MQAEKSDPMKDALAARRGKGLEIIIGLGHPNGDREGAGDEAPRSANGYGMRDSGGVDNNSVSEDLAPPPDSVEDKQAVMGSARGMHAPNPPGVVSSQHENAPGDATTPDDARAHFSENLSENDIRDMANRKPRSLGERARQFAFRNKGKEKVQD